MPYAKSFSFRKSKTYTQSTRPLDKNQSSKFGQSGVKQTHFQNLKEKRKCFFDHRGTLNSSIPPALARSDFGMHCHGASELTHNLLTQFNLNALSKREKSFMSRPPAAFCLIRVVTQPVTQ